MLKSVEATLQRRCLHFLCLHYLCLWCWCLQCGCLQLDVFVYRNIKFCIVTGCNEKIMISCYTIYKRISIKQIFFIEQKLFPKNIKVNISPLSCLHFNKKQSKLVTNFSQFVKVHFLHLMKDLHSHNLPFLWSISDKLWVPWAEAELHGSNQMTKMLN